MHEGYEAIYLSVCLSVSPSICLPACLFICPFIYLSQNNYLYTHVISLAVNDTDTDCPVDDMDEVCGSDGITYSSVCRMLIESDGVYPMYDGPCNRTECQDAPVSNH